MAGVMPPMPSFLALLKGQQSPLQQHWPALIELTAWDIFASFTLKARMRAQAENPTKFG